LSRRLPPSPRHEWAFFFDLDGTLIDFTETPAAVRVGDELRLLLERLYRDTGGAVALISGRTIRDIDSLFPHTRMPVAGQHGAERRSALGIVTLHPVAAQRFERVRLRMADAVHGKAGLLLENKGLSLALHYRRAPRLAGKYLVEMRPAGKDKGAAILDFLNEQPFQDRTAVFVGDDASDEFGFATVNRLGGYSIKVGLGRSAARWHLPNVRAVRAWLAS